MYNPETCRVPELSGQTQPIKSKEVQNPLLSPWRANLPLTLSQHDQCLPLRPLRHRLHRRFSRSEFSRGRFNAQSGHS